MTTVTIRRAEESDVDALGRLGAMLMETHYAFDSRRFLAPRDGAEEGYASFLHAVLGSTDGAIFVADERGEVSGYVYVALEPLSWKELRGPAGFVHDLLVLPHLRRTGVALKLMETAIDWLRERGAPRVLLGTAAANDAAQTLFRRLGFRPTMLEMTKELEPTSS